MPNWFDDDDKKIIRAVGDFLISPTAGAFVFNVIVAACVIVVLFSIIEADDRKPNRQGILDSALEKAESGRATEMSIEEMDAFRVEQLRISSEHRQKIRERLTPEEQASQDYDDYMILRDDY